uniref:Uncharacterized protein n=1 Tax=Tetranychus urticae TaxID=32264 RepID=T1L0Z7_TETUR
MKKRASEKRSAQTTEPTVNNAKRQKKVQGPADSSQDPEINKGVECVGRGGRGARQKTQEREETQDSNTLQDDVNSLWRSLDSYRGFQKIFKADGFMADTMRVIYTLACAVKKLDPTLGAESAVEGIVFLDEETLVKQQIQIMEVKNKNIKKSFYHTCTNNSGELLTKKQLDDILCIHIGSLSDEKYYFKGRTGHVLNHIWRLSGFKYVCFYCPEYSNANTQHFKEHFIKHHWPRGFGEVSIQKKSTKTVITDSESDDDNSKKKPEKVQKKMATKSKGKVSRNSGDVPDNENTLK